MKKTSLFVPLLAAVFVSAHGFLQTLTINDKNYTGNDPLASEDKHVLTPIQTVFTYSPVKDLTSPSLTCGNSTPVVPVADANPGDKLTMYWADISGLNWIHPVGYLAVYMAKVDNFDLAASSLLKFFKINQQARKVFGDPWILQTLYDGGPVYASVPSNIVPGNYLMRAELAALHLATEPGGAEFYPVCVQMKIGGSGTGEPQPSELAKFPGAYSPTDPGILFDAYTNTSDPYHFPGPPVAAFVSGANPNPSGDSSTTAATTSGLSSSSTTTTPTGTTFSSSYISLSTTTTSTETSSGSSLPYISPSSTTTSTTTTSGSSSSDISPSSTTTPTATTTPAATTATTSTAAATSVPETCSNESSSTTRPLPSAGAYHVVRAAHASHFGRSSRRGIY